MSRLPFDPQRAPGAKRATPESGEARPLSVSQLSAIIDHALRDHVPAGLRVAGEIGQFRARTHWYFDLKDADAVIACVMWQSAARKAGFTPSPGQQVVVSGRVEFYPPQGRTQFIVDRIEPAGDGALDLALKKLVEEVRALGWLDEARKRALPMLPRRVAVVTSASGAALQDVRDTVARRCPSVQLCLVDVRVQGPGAAGEVTRAVRRLGAMHAELGIDTIIVTRGGGSKEDLWCFNDRELARAIVESPVPVVAAIGHETDVTLAELVADARAATPTQAAMRAVPDAAALREQIRSASRRLAGGLTRRVRADEQRLASLVRHARVVAMDLVRRRAHRTERLAARLERHRPSAVYAERTTRLQLARARLEEAMRARLDPDRVDDTAGRLAQVVARAVHDRRLAVEAAARNLDLVGPPGVLKRGYSVTLDADGRAVRRLEDVPPAGQVVRTRLIDGVFASTVRSSEAGDDADAGPIAAAPAGRRDVPKPAPADALARARPGRAAASRKPRRPGGAEGSPGLFDAPPGG